ncbi:hypothetical protein AB1Y20_016561 [Prymnesium parvum]|uniref:Amino acid transporter transmembrane domain-containing protein n=1 Tax=Prymnesium parvum TaxID=97485 RepID=A0AB34ICZ0_PRYPA
MFQSASRYLPALPAGLPGAKFLRFEVPDTTFYSLAGTTFNLLNGTTGPGLLALPLAFSRCGYLTAASLLLLTFGFNHLALQYLLKSCLATREHSYIGLSLRAGPHVAAMVDWASLVFFFGSCVSYLVIIGDTFSLVSAHIGAWLGAAGPFYKAGVALHYSYLSLGMLSAFTGFCLLPLSMLRSMDSLQVTSGVAMLCIIYAIGVIVCTPPQPASLRDAASLPLSVDPFDPSDESPKEQTPSPQAAVPFRFSSESMLALPTMAFCFASQSLFPPALETLHQPATYHHLQNVVDVTMYTTFALHLLVGLSGYLRYGSETAPNVLDNLPPSPAVGVARLAIVLAFAFTYPMMIFLCRMHIQSIMARWELASQPTDAPTPVPSVESYHRLVSVLLVGASLACSVLFPNIDMLFGLLGGTTAVVISFVAPSIFWDQFVGYMYKWSHPRKLMSRALLGFAALIASLALPAIVVDILGDLYATAWWVPMSTGSGLRQWSGGIQIVEGGAQSNGQT